MPRRSGAGNRIAGRAGFTLVEILVALVLAALLAALAAPSYVQWREAHECRQTARGIVSLLREARSRAIMTNREHRVEFPPEGGRYGLRAGDRAQDTRWHAVPPVSAWVYCPPDVSISSNAGPIQFNTNGTANGGTITVKNMQRMKAYDVTVVRTGRIHIKIPRRE